MIRKKLGKGEAYYFGAAFTQQAAAEFLRRFGLAEAFSAWLDAPSGCELALRKKDGKRWLFVLNYGSQATEITVKHPLRELFSGETQTGAVTVPKYGVSVFLLPEAEK